MGRGAAAARSCEGGCPVRSTAVRSEASPARRRHGAAEASHEAGLLPCVGRERAVLLYCVLLYSIAPDGAWLALALAVRYRDAELEEHACT